MTISSNSIKKDRRLSLGSPPFLRYQRHILITILLLSFSINGFSHSVLDSDIAINSIGLNNSISTDITVNAPELLVTKAVDDATPDEGQLITYTITVKNLGDAPATGVQVTDLLPAGVTFSAINTIPGGQTYTSGTGTWDVGSISTGTTYTLKIDATPDVGTNGTTITNTAYVSVLDQTDPIASNDTASIDILVNAPELLVTKAVDDATPDEGQLITYTITVKNLGDAPATGVQVTDLLPAGVTFSAINTISGGQTYTSGTGTWDVGSISTGTTYTLKIDATPDVGTNGTTITNTAYVSVLDQTDPIASNDTASIDILVNAPELLVTKAVDDATPDEGQLITYTITVKNLGDAPATGVQVTDLLPAGVTFSAINTISGGQTYTSGTGIWDVGAISTGTTYTLKIDATPDVGTNGTTVTNTAYVSVLDQTDPIAANDTASVNVLVNSPELLVTMAVNDGTPNEGQLIIYTITVKNQGDAPATGVQVTDLLPAGVTFSAINTIPGGQTYTSGTGIWDVGAISTGTTYTLKIDATVDTGITGSTVTNTASVSALDQTDPIASNDLASVDIIVNRPDIQITKIVSAAPYNEGQNVIYTINAENIGDADATGLQVKDILAGVLTYVSSSPDQGTYTAGTGIWDIGTLTSGSDLNLTITAYPNVGASGTAINNTALLEALDQNDTNTANNTSSVEIEVATIDLSVVKTVDDNTPDEGQTIEFGIEVENLGPGDGSTINVEDVLPAGFTFVGFTSTPPGSFSESGGTIQWTIPSLLEGSAEELLFEVTVDASTAAQTITNYAEVTDFDQVDPDRENNIASVDVFVNGADLEVSKTVDNLAPNPGETIVYTIVITNNGPLSANNITIADALPSGVSYVSSTITQGTAYNSGAGTWFANDINAGLTATLTITATVDAGTVGSSITNTAFVQSVVEGDSYTSNNTASAKIAIGEADLGITKSVSAPLDGIAFNESEALSYTLVVENYGPDDAPLVEVADMLPSNVTYVSHSGGTYNETSGIWTIGTLTNGSTTSLTIDATVNTNTAGLEIVNTATVSSPMAEPVAATNSNTNNVSLQVHGADLEVTKTTSAIAPIVEGDVIEYTVTITNNGPDDATGIEVLDYLPSNFTFNSSAPSEGSYDEGTGIWTGIALLNGESAMLTINVTIANGGGITNTASITTSSELDAYTSNNTASVFISALRIFEEGACIINLGQIPQTYDNTLKAYGLIYDIVANNMIPVWWSIRPDKSFQSETAKVDEIDFTVDGVDYRNGAFIIDTKFVPFAQPIIDQWLALYPDLDINCNQPAFEAPIHAEITSFPRAVLDEANGSIIESAFYTNAALATNIIGYNDPPTNNEPIYDLYRPDGTPLNLTSCDDIYAMPHADPHIWTNAEIDTFYNYIQNGGWLWVACHAVSSLELLVDVPQLPGGAPQMNLLSNAGLIEWGDHGDGTLPYSYTTTMGSYNTEAASDPFMQFAGNIDAALQSGSEQIYIPQAAGWRPSTTVALWDPDHPDRLGDEYPLNAAAALVYGRAFGDPDLGMIMYETSHSVASGTEAENVGAARVFGNFWLQAGMEFRPEITPVSIPDKMNVGETVNFSVTGSGLTEPLSYQWISNCAGTFTDPYAASTDFTPVSVDVPTECVMRLVLQDACGRQSFLAEFYTVYPLADVEITKVAPATADAGDNITYTISVKNNGPNTAYEVEVQDTLPTGVSYLSDIASQGTWSGPIWTVGNIVAGETVSLDLTVSTDPNLLTGNISNTATVTTPASGNLVTNDTSTVNTFITARPIANDDELLNQILGATVSLDILANDLAEDAAFPTPGEVSVVLDHTSVTGGILNGDGSVTVTNEGTWTYNSGTGFLEFAPLGTFKGDPQDLTYTLLEIATGLTDDATINIEYINRTKAISDFNNSAYERPVVGNVSSNDIDLEGNTQSFTLDGANGGMPVGEGIVILNIDGTYTYTPAALFSGETQFSYAACDDGSPVACDTALVFIEVLPPVSAEGGPVIANPDANTVEAGNTTTGTVMSNDFDIDDRVIAVTTPLNAVTVSGVDEDGNVVADAGTLTINTDGTYSFTPTGSFTGEVTPQSYTICTSDSPAVCDNSILEFNVIPNSGNNTFANDDAVITDVGIKVNSDVSINDTDPESEAQAITSYLFDSDGDGGTESAGTIGGVTQIGGTDDIGDYVADAGDLILNADGTYSFTPTTGFIGNVIVTYQTCDNATPIQACKEATLLITVLDAKRDYGDAPVAYPAAWHRAMTDTNEDNVLDGTTDVWLGTNTGFEFTEQTNASAEGDTYDDAMSFGSGPGQFPLVATPSTNYNVDIVLNSSGPDVVFYGLWIDWDNDGTYEDFYSGSGVTASPTTVIQAITTPATMGSPTVNVRLRADDEPLVAADYIGGKTNGEIEDYQSVVALPVELSRFEGIVDGCNNRLTWTTESEEGFSHYELERSEDGTRFAQIKQIQGSGGLSLSQSYQYYDEKAPAQSYYRLKMVDLDGSMEYSDVLFLQTECGAENSMIVYPNPLGINQGLLSVKFYSEHKEVELIIFNTQRQGVRRMKLPAEQSSWNLLRLDMSDLPVGAYFLRNMSSLEVAPFIIHD